MDSFDGNNAANGSRQLDNNRRRKGIDTAKHKLSKKVVTVVNVLCRLNLKRRVKANFVVVFF